MTHGTRADPPLSHASDQRRGRGECVQTGEKVEATLGHTAPRSVEACLLLNGTTPTPQLSSSAKVDDPVLRDANDRSEKPRRTGCPACAGHDSVKWTASACTRDDAAAVSSSLKSTSSRTASDSDRDPGPIRRGDRCLADGRRPSPTMACCEYGSRPSPGRRGSHTGSAMEYFTWLSAKLDSIEAMPSSRVSLVFRNVS